MNYAIKLQKNMFMERKQIILINVGSMNYFCATTGNASTETVKKYIENKKNK
jgi:REP element-mobilizing transposase RayT